MTGTSPIGASDATPSVPRFFVPVGDPMPLRPAGPSARVVDSFYFGDSRWVIVANQDGTLRPLEESERKNLTPDVRRTLNAHELAGPLRRIHARHLWLFALQRVQPGLQSPGLNDPVEAVGVLCGPFPSAAPQALRGHLTTTRGELMDGLARGAWHPFRYRDHFLGNLTITSAMLAGAGADALERGDGLVLAYPELGDFDNESSVMRALHDVLMALREDQQEEGGGSLSDVRIPPPDRRSQEASLRERGFEVQGDTAVRSRGGLLGWLFREKMKLGELGTLSDFLTLVQRAFTDMDGWPTPRTRAVHRRLELQQVSWSAERSHGIALLPVDGAHVAGTCAVSMLPDRFRASGSLEDQLNSSYRCLYFTVDPAFSAFAGPEVLLEVEFLDDQKADGASLSCSYDSTEGPNKYKGHAYLTGSRKWRRMALDLSSVEMRGRDCNGADFRIQIKALAQVYVRSVTLRRGKGGAAPSAPAEEAPAQASPAPVAASPAKKPAEKKDPAGKQSPRARGGPRKSKEKNKSARPEKEDPCESYPS